MPPGVDMASILSWLSPSPVINTHTQEEEEEGSTDASLLALSELRGYMSQYRCRERPRAGIQGAASLRT